MTHVFFLFLAIVLKTESFLLDKKLGEQSFYLQQVESEKHLNQKRLTRLLSTQYSSERTSVLLEEESVLRLVEIEWESSKYRTWAEVTQNFWNNRQNKEEAAKECLHSHNKTMSGLLKAELNLDIIEPKLQQRLNCTVCTSSFSGYEVASSVVMTLKWVKLP